jgi:hypothetical protein
MIDFRLCSGSTSLTSVQGSAGTGPLPWGEGNLLVVIAHTLKTSRRAKVNQFSLRECLRGRRGTFGATPQEWRDSRLRRKSQCGVFFIEKSSIR